MQCLRAIQREIAETLPHWASVREVASLIGISKRKLYKEIREDKLKANRSYCQNGKVRQYYLSTEELMTWLEKKSDFELEKLRDC